jgi:hypothetical protein
VASDSLRRALTIAAIFVLVLGASIFALMYWFGHGQLRSAARASLKVDLRNLAVAESLYFARHHTYTASLAELPDFHPRNDVSIERADSSGWEASAVQTHSSLLCTFGLRDVTVKCD